MTATNLTEEQATNLVRDQGNPGGLFRSCMDTIRRSHSVGQALRTAALAAGVMSDRICYAELLAQFYVATAALELRLKDRKDASEMVKRVADLDYAFSPGYEADLMQLLGGNWRARVQGMMTKSSKQYVAMIQNGSDLDLVAAAFILWGPLVIGGGAALKPRVKKSFGENATNVFESVVGGAKGGRVQRRKDFIVMIDGLLGEGGAGRDAEFRSIVAASAAFMDLNNGMMQEVRQSPWWSKYVWAGAAVVACVVVAKFRSSR
jgi:hypothetical protein